AQNSLQAAEADLKQSESLREAAANTLTNSMHVPVSLAFSPDSRTLVSASEDGGMGIWNAETGTPWDSIAPTSKVSQIVFASPDALLSRGEDGLRAWSTNPAWKLERVLGSAHGTSPFADRINSVRFSPDGLLLATGGGEPSRSGELHIWRVKDGQLAHDLKNIHSDVILSLAFTPDGRYLASGAADRFAKITELATARVVRSLEGHTHHVLSVNWKRDGHTLATAGADNLVKIWDGFTGEKKKNIEGFTKEVTSISFVGDSDQALVCSGDTTLKLLKENGETVRAFENTGDYLQSALATGNGRWILAGGHKGVLKVWAAATGKLLTEFK
ncbi:MAG TPA: WD40 repeat domain-containing protein, partial [Verrucomicrobiae bacterium]|nr:WD40 repeat domain-containing protein [Verrucomicrobiae bacterium]